MNFPITVLNDLAKKLRSREVSGRYDELTAYSNALIHQNHSGNNPIMSSDFTQQQFDLLVGDSDLEYYFPLPYGLMHICEPAKTVQFNDLPPIVLGAYTDFFGMGGYSGPRWSIVAKGEDGKYYLLASEDEYAFEPGTLIREAEEPNAPIRVGHAHIYGTHVVYELVNWAAVAHVLGDNRHPSVEIARHRTPLSFEPEQELDDDTDTADDGATGDDRESAPRAECEQVSNINFSKLLSQPELLLPFTISRETTWQDFVDYCQQNLLNHWDFTYKVPYAEDDATDAETADDTPAQPKRDQALILETLQDIERTFVADDVFEALGVKVPAEVTPVSVANVIGRLMTVEAETVEVQLDEDEMQAQAKVMKVLNIEAIVKEVTALAKSKRTPKNIKAIAAKYA